ncbi:hypothetical protein ACWD3D_32840, partial [Streptomyces sp. NPDC002690]
DRWPSAPDPAPWTPEAARASISSVVSGTLRGRAALGADEARSRPATDPPEAAPSGVPPLPSSPNQQHGGRS